MKRILIISLLLSIFYNTAHAGLKVFTCEPEWSALVTELGGNKVTVYSAITALQDPHHIEARPSLIAKMRRARLVVCTGGGLEAGWLPLLLRQAANPNVQMGSDGYFEASSFVAKLEVPQLVDRSMGDVHAQGNPHIHLDPNRILTISKELTARLKIIDTVNGDYYQQRFDDFQRRWQSAIQQWQQQAVRLQEMPVVVHHKDWVYLFEWLGIHSVATLEPKPGIPPSAGHLAKVKRQIQSQPVKMVLYTPHQSDKAAKWLAKEVNIPAVKLPYTVGGSDKAIDLFGLFDDTVQKLLDASQQ